MSLDILETNFSGLSNGDFILRMSTIADKLEVHPVFNAFPEYVSGPERLRKMAEQLKNAVDAAANGDRQKVSEKKALRAEAEQATTITAQHLVMISIHKKDPDVLLNTGFDMKQHRTYKNLSSNAPAVLSRFKVKNGPVSGMVIATVNRVPGAGSIELQATEGDPSVESSWHTLGTFFQCRMEVKYLEPVKKFHFRARYHNTGGAGQWTPTVSLVII